MACQRCESGSVRVVEEGKAVHYVGNEGRGVDRFFCDDQPAHVDDTPPISDIERQNLYAIIEIASTIRMKHDVGLYDALDWVRELFKEATSPFPPGFPRQRVVDELLSRHGHVCTPACREPKDVV